MKVILTRPHLDYKEGDEMEISPEMGAYLIRVGAAKEKPEKTKEKDAIPGKKDK